MVRVMKSPNMMSTTGRSPVIAAPTPIPVNPASEIGVSSTRSRPNSSTNPDNTLKGVPASATSSPKMHTRGSRRISSASASRTACANVNSRTATSGINALLGFFRLGIRRGNREFHRRFHLRSHFLVHLFERGRIRDLLRDHPFRKVLDGVALRLPLLLFLLRAVIFAIDVANVMPHVAVGIANQKCRPFALARASDQPLCRAVDRSHILPIHALRVHPERGAPCKHVPRRRLRIVRVFVIEIVF